MLAPILKLGLKQFPHIYDEAFTKTLIDVLFRVLIFLFASHRGFQGLGVFKEITCPSGTPISGGGKKSKDLIIKTFRTVP